MLQEKKYSRILKEGEALANKWKDKIKKDSIGNIYKLISQAAKLQNDNKKYLFYKLKGLGHTNSQFKLGVRIVSCIFVILVIGQFLLFKLGMIKPIKISYNFLLPSEKIDVGESKEISAGYKVVPFYYKNLNINIKPQDVGIVKVINNKVIGIKEGKTKLNIYLDDEIVKSKEIVVEKIQLIDFDFTKETYSKTLSKVNDSIQLMFNLNIKDNRKIKIQPLIESSDNRIIQVGNKGNLKAVGVGECEVYVTINDICKTLKYNITENIEYAEHYIFPNSDKRYLETWELEDLDIYTLYLVKNEIYARKGYIFEDEFYNNYFNEMPWYHGRETEMNKLNLNDYELENIKKIDKIKEE